jgi:hypothetical protein
VERAEEARQAVRGVPAAGDGGPVGRFAGNPGRDGPRPGEAVGGLTDPYEVRYGKREERGQNGHPSVLLAQEGRRAFRARHAYGEFVSETPQLVVPAAVHRTEFEPCEVRMLLAHQGTHQVLVDREAVHALTQPSVDQRGW